MAQFDAHAEAQEKAKVRQRGVALFTAGALMALSPFVAIAVLEPGPASLGVPSLALVLLSAIALPLSPIALVAGVVDIFWPRTPTCPPCKMQL